MATSIKQISILARFCPIYDHSLHEVFEVLTYTKYLNQTNESWGMETFSHSNYRKRSRHIIFRLNSISILKSYSMGLNINLYGRFPMAASWSKPQCCNMNYKTIYKTNKIWHKYKNLTMHSTSSNCFYIITNQVSVKILSQTCIMLKWTYHEA